MNVSFRYARSKGGIPPSSRVSRLNRRLIAYIKELVVVYTAFRFALTKRVPPNIAPPTTSF
jgi:hypothetical protein